MESPKEKAEAVFVEAIHSYVVSAKAKADAAFAYAYAAYTAYCKADEAHDKAIEAGDHGHVDHLAYMACDAYDKADDAYEEAENAYFDLIKRHAEARDRADDAAEAEACVKAIDNPVEVEGTQESTL